ncbi:MAG TPA: hypothetical protein VMN57_11785 [Anaerolineales bacterium]|nr:hypothetical protein [Anaerolineales bacterium]
MPRLHLPHLIQDRQYLRDGGDILLATPIQTFSATDDGLFRDGPVHPRLAVVDLDADTRTLRPPTRFRPQAIGKTVSAYDLGGVQLDADSAVDDFENDDFLRLNPFATVLKTLHFFEGAEILGRPVRWAFPSEQLLIVPRAGEMRNAFYDRGTGSLQFFHHLGAGGFTVYTALSHDIIVHETAHAILDGLAPDLYHATDPQSLALHEALADLAAISQTLVNEMIVFSLDAISSTTVDPFEALSRLAEEFGTDARLAEGARHVQGASFLRRLKNDRTLDPADDTTDDFGRPNRTDPADPHALSQVLSGAVYTVFEMRMRKTERKGDFLSGLQAVFCPAARRVARIVFRALDYLPPGEANFLDYGRAFHAAAAATYARPQLEQRALADAFVRRGIAGSHADLAQPAPPDLGLDRPLIDALLTGPAALREFAEKHRAALGIPGGADFEALDPVTAHRSLRSNPGAKREEEFIFRFRWTETETIDPGLGLPKTWAAVRGTTLVVNAGGKILSTLMTSGNGGSGRAALLRRWAGEGRLRLEADAIGPDGQPLEDVVILKLADGVAQAAGGGKTLHLARGFE